MRDRFALTQIPMAPRDGIAMDAAPTARSSRAYHASSSLPQADATAKGAADEAADLASARSSSSPGAISHSLRAPIVADLKSVDFDGNRRIDADELQALLGKYNETDAEILELCEIFYTSTGAASVEIYRFMEALDAAAGDRSTSGGGETDGGEATPLAVRGKFKTHPLGIGTCASEYMYTKTHGKYTEDDLAIEATHVPPVTFSRSAIPGIVAAIIRHLCSLRNMTRDGGMLDMFIKEANNERMHLLTFIRMMDPGYLFRAAVIGAQSGFGSFFLVAYVVSPAWCHRVIGYIEEEAVHTYTKILTAMEEAEEGSELHEWKTGDAPKIAKGYWHLGEHGTVYVVMRAVRADEAEHRDVNHAVSGVPDDAVNPLYDPRAKLDNMLKKYENDIMKKEAQKVREA